MDLDQAGVRKMSHTEGKLGIDRHGNIKTEDQDDFRVRGATLSGRDVAEANTRRLVACWNACGGIKQDTIEELAAMPNAIMHLTLYSDSLEKERDEALEALRNLERVSGIAMMADDPARVAARAILAKHQKVME